MASETGIGIIIAIVIMMFFLQSMEIGRKHEPIKLLFNLTAIWLMVAAVNIAQELAIDDALSTDIISNLEIMYVAVFSVAIFVSFYWFLVFFQKYVLSWVRSFKNKGDDPDEVGIEDEE